MRVGLAWLLVVALAGCKLGFDDLARPPSDGAAGDAARDSAVPGLDAPPIAGGSDVRLVVVSDEYGSDMIGTPIPGATVLVDRGAGLERSVTDAAGTAQFAAAGVVACHVVVKGELGWRIYTLVAPRAGTIELGGRPASNLAHSMTFTIPDDGAGGYTLRVLTHCATPPTYGATRQLGVEYDSHCEGQTGRVVAFALSSVAGGTPRYLDAGDVALVNGSTHTITGDFQPLPRDPVTLEQLPDGTSYVLPAILARTGLDLVDLAPNAAGTTPKPGTDVTTVSTGAAPGGNTLSVLIANTLPLQYSSTSQILIPVTIGNPIALEASALLPMFQSLVLTQPPDVSWTGSGDRGTILVVETITGNVQWDAYLDPTASAVAFPALPADLGITTPDHFDFASVNKIEVPGATRADVARTIDRTWSLWPHDASLFPAAGSASARILYSVGLGPPLAPDDVAARRSITAARPAAATAARQYR